MEHLEVEEQIISAFLNHQESIKKWTQTAVTKDYFDEVHHPILSGVLYAFNNSVQLTRQSYKEFLSHYKKLTPAESASQISIFNRCLMKVANKDDLPMLLDKVRLFYLHRKTAHHFSAYNKDREKLGDIGANRALIDKLTALEADASETKSKFIEIQKAKDGFMEKLYERRNNPQSRLTCDIKEIDSTMNVGFKKGHLTMFCADVGAYKTTIMSNVATNIFKRSGENVLYVPLEMEADEILLKIVSRETRIPFDIIEHADRLSEEQIKAIATEMDKWNENSHRFSILEMAERTKVSIIRREIEKRISYFQPRVVFVDYADNLVPDISRGSRSDLEMNDMLEDLRKMGKALGFSVVSAAQLSRDALKKVMEQKEGKQQLGSTDIRGGQVMTANSDTVYAQLRDPQQPKDQLLFFCIKARHGKNTFENGHNKTVLKVTPEIGLIESPNDYTLTTDSDFQGITDIPTMADEDGTDNPF